MCLTPAPTSSSRRDDEEQTQTPFPPAPFDATERIDKLPSRQGPSRLVRFGTSNFGSATLVIRYRRHCRWSRHDHGEAVSGQFVGDTPSDSGALLPSLPPLKSPAESPPDVHKTLPWEPSSCRGATLRPRIVGNLVPKCGLRAQRRSERLTAKQLLFQKCSEAFHAQLVHIFEMTSACRPANFDRLCLAAAEVGSIFVDRIWPGVPQCRPNLGQVWLSMFAKFGQTWPQLGIGRNSCRVGPRFSGLDVCPHSRPGLRILYRISNDPRSGLRLSLIVIVICALCFSRLVPRFALLCVCAPFPFFASPLFACAIGRGLGHPKRRSLLVFLGRSTFLPFRCMVALCRSLFVLLPPNCFVSQLFCLFPPPLVSSLVVGKIAKALQSGRPTCSQEVSCTISAADNLQDAISVKAIVSRTWRHGGDGCPNPHDDVA